MIFKRTLTEDVCRHVAPKGEFVIRARGSEADVLALSVRDPVGGLTTAIVELADNAFTLRGTDERFETLDALVAVRLSAAVCSCRCRRRRRRR